MHAKNLKVWIYISVSHACNGHVINNSLVPTTSILIYIYIERDFRQENEEFCRYHYYLPFSLLA